MDRARLSPAQRRLARALASLPEGDTLFPPSGLSASAWWRSARVLVRLGLATTNGYVLWPTKPPKEPPPMCSECGIYRCAGGPEIGYALTCGKAGCLASASGGQHGR